MFWLRSLTESITLQRLFRPSAVARQDWALHLISSQPSSHDTIDEWYRLLIQFVMFQK